MLSIFTNGVYGILDILLVGWALGLLWLAGCAVRLPGDLSKKAAGFLTEEKYLFGGWGGELRGKIGGWLFLIAVLALQLATFFLNSLVRETAGAWYGPLTQAVELLYLWAILLKMLLFTRYSGRQLAVGFCFFFVFRWVFINNHSFWMILGILFALAAKDAPLRRTLKAGLAVSTACFAAVVLGSLAGLIPTLQIAAPAGAGRSRDSFGYGWYNMTGAVLLGICLMYICWRQIKNLKWWDFVLLVGALVFCDQGPDSRAATVCIALIIALAGMLRLVPKVMNIYCVRMLACAIPVISFCVSLLGGMLYNSSNRFWTQLDALFSGRLSLANEAISQTQIAIAGQQLAGKDFLVDNFYAYLWIYGGPVASLLLWGSVAVLLWRLIKNGAATESACVIVMLAHAFMEGHFAWPCVNVTLWLLPCVFYWLLVERTPCFASEKQALDGVK